MPLLSPSPCIHGPLQSISYVLTLIESKVVTVSTCGSALDTRLDIARVMPDPETDVATNDDHVRPTF